MTPQEKAIELYVKFDDYPLTVEWKKQCAIITVNEILDSLSITDSSRVFWYDVVFQINKYNPYE